MGSPFKMNPKTPLMKALVGKQGNLPQQLQDAIKAAPTKKTNKFIDDGVDKAESKEVKIKGGRGRTQTVTKQTVKRVVPRSAGEKTSSEKKAENTIAARQGEGRLGTKTTITGGSSTRESTALGGTAKDTSGRTRYRTLADGTKVVVEGTVSSIKPRGVDKSPAKSYGKSPVKSTGKKKKLGTEGMSYKEKLAYYEKQKKANPTKNPKIRMGMGTSYTTIRK